MSAIPRADLREVEGFCPRPFWCRSYPCPGLHLDTVAGHYAAVPELLPRWHSMSVPLICQRIETLPPEGRGSVAGVRPSAYCVSIGIALSGSRSTRRRRTNLASPMGLLSRDPQRQQILMPERDITGHEHLKAPAGRLDSPQISSCNWVCVVARRWELRSRPTTMVGAESRGSNTGALALTGTDAQRPSSHTPLK